MTARNHAKPYQEKLQDLTWTLVARDMNGIPRKIRIEQPGQTTNIDSATTHPYMKGYV